jgi:hypothetical protein
MKRIYDGSQFCENCDHCPVADFDLATKTVEIYDPAKPENGRLKMSVEEWNTLTANAKPVK